MCSNYSLLIIITKKYATFLLIPIIGESSCPTGFESAGNPLCYKVIDQKVEFSYASRVCNSELSGNPFWFSRLGEPRTANAVEAAWNITASIAPT